MGLKIKINEIGIKIREWNEKQDRKSENLTNLKKVRIVHMFITIYLAFYIFYYMQPEVLRDYLFLEFILIGLMVSYHIKIKKKKVYCILMVK